MAGLNLSQLLHKHFDDPRRERLFLASTSFLLAFALVRAVTHAIRADIGPFKNVDLGGGKTHLHHLVVGILLLLATGYLWLIQVGFATETSRPRMHRLTAMLYGVGSALTLDEFALWLNLQDVYWDREGRESIDAVVLFSGLLSAGIWGAPFLRGLAHELASPFRR